MEKLRFKEWINDKRYAKIKEFCVNNCLKYKMDSNDILSLVVERMLKSNPIIEKEETFFNFVILKNVRWYIYKTLGKQKGITDKLPTIKVEEELDLNRDKSIENMLKPIKNSKYWVFYEDRYLHQLSHKELSEKYKISEKVVNDRLTKIRNILKGKIVKETESKYKGIAKIDEKGKIVKMYPNSKLLLADGYDRTIVSKCCNGKVKKHKGYSFKFIKDIETCQQKLTENQSN